ncbi:MAG: hypothetical protein JAY90_21520 [Candidatus Thiodiazotropha lotti]|nr:hypothetical protein [Candidatus Thiodiazotropha lotti]
MANAGVPMIFLVMPALALSIIPIIAIEAMYLSKKLRLPFSTSLGTTTISNLVSTVIGVPLTWLLLLLIQIIAGGSGAFGLDTTTGKVLSVTLQAAWLIPYESDLYWMIPSAGALLLIPFFFISWWSEFYVSMKLLKEQASQRLKIAVRNANILTYTLLAIWPIGFWILNNPNTQ